MNSHRWAIRVVALTFLTLAACQDARDPTAPTPELNAARPDLPSQARAWFQQASTEVLALPQTVYADYEETTGQLVFGVEHSGVNRGVEQALARLGVPRSAYRIVTTPPITLALGLRDVWDPTRGGIQIHFSNWLCTLGFNADFGTDQSFVTNSHCTDSQGGVEGTQYYQPVSSASGVIAVEVDDPGYNRSGGCPRGRKCRSSDASRALYNGTRPSERGLIARTSGPNNGLFSVVGDFTITAQANTINDFANGTTMNKVGRTTGWTQGTVVASCVDVNVSGSNIMQRCQTLVQNDNAVIVGSGDSGSPVFEIISGTNVNLTGILWGSSGSNMFVMSPVKNIIDELGGFTATRDGSGGADPGDPGGEEPKPCEPKGPNGNNCK